MISPIFGEVSYWRLPILWRPRNFARISHCPPARAPSSQSRLRLAAVDGVLEKQALPFARELAVLFDRVGLGKGVTFSPDFAIFYLLHRVLAA